MPFGLVAGLLAGIIGAGVGVYFVLYAAGFFQYLGGKKNRPNAVSKDILLGRLLASNDPSKPYHIVKGEETDLIAEWKIVDASWYGVFSKSWLGKAYRAILLLDETRHAVRCYEEIGSVSWTAGTNGLSPSVHYHRSFFGGRILFKKEYGRGYAIREPTTLETGKVYDYRFDIDDIRKPIIQIVQESGWEWVPVTAKRHAIHKQSL